MNKKIISNFIVFFLVAGFLLAAHSVLAQVDLGTNAISDTIKLSATNPITIATRIINIFLGLLALIAVSLIIFAGFKWMTSEGSEEKITVAKNILKNAAIGLVIILASWGVVSFILKQFVDVTGGNEQVNVGKSGFEVGGGFGAVGSCTVQSVYPEPNQVDVARNTSLIITFKETADTATICADQNGAACACSDTCNFINPKNIKIYQSAVGDDITTNMTKINVTADPLKQTFVLTPLEYLGNADSNTSYTIDFTSDIKKANGDLMFGTCAPDYLKWQFEVSTKLDLTPPTVTSIFPGPDNDQDTVTTVAAAFAKGSFVVKSLPTTYQEAKIINIIPGRFVAMATATISSTYDGDVVNFRINALPESNKAQLSDNDAKVSLGVVSFSGNEINFPGFVNLKVDGAIYPGNEWTINVAKQVLPDTINIASDTYTFVSDASVGYKIKRMSDLNAQALEITKALSSQEYILPSVNGAEIRIIATDSGVAGNDIILSSSNPSAISANLMSGGQNGVTSSVSPSGTLDKPRNSTIQINFSEAINPMTIVGASSEVSNTISVRNSDNQIISGKFVISNAYKTVEFVSSDECGVNGCGGKIYCLPGNNKISVNISAAPLTSCSSDSDCVAKAPYSKCGYPRVTQNGVTANVKSCQDDEGNNYPLATLSDPVDGSTRGVMDLAMNSMDGNRDGGADGLWVKTPDTTSSYVENYKNAYDSYNQLVEALIKKRSETGKTFFELVNDDCSFCDCGWGTRPILPDSCSARIAKISSALNLTGIFSDSSAKKYWLVDENEKRGVCSLDTFAYFINYPNNSSNISFILPFSEQATSCDTQLTYNPNSNHKINFWKNPAGDSYSFYFYTSNELKVNPPKIEYISPSGGEVDLNSPVIIRFNSLMSVGTLKSGSIDVSNGDKIVNHKLLNLYSAAPVGYWVESNNATSTANPLEPSVTVSYIKHSAFGEGLKYNAQSGSGVNDIYQNCFKPSVGPGCTATDSNPSCCNGIATSTLNASGNCQ